MQVLVRDNNVDQALKALKKKMQREGIFREMKLRGHYEKPSEKRAREKAEAVRRARKLARKKLQREGLLPMKPKVIPGAAGGPGGAGGRGRIGWWPWRPPLTASDLSTRDKGLIASGPCILCASVEPVIPHQRNQSLLYAVGCAEYGHSRVGAFAGGRTLAWNANARIGPPDVDCVTSLFAVRGGGIACFAGGRLFDQPVLVFAGV